MDNVNAVATIISTVCFPIAMCLILVYYMNATNQKLIEAITALKVAITELIAKEDSYHGRDH